MRFDFTPKRYFDPLSPDQAERLAEQQKKFNDQLEKTKDLLDSIEEIDSDIAAQLKKQVDNASALNIKYGIGKDVLSKANKLQEEAEVKINILQQDRDRLLKKYTKAKTQAAKDEIESQLRLITSQIKFNQALDTNIRLIQQAAEEEKKITEEKKKQNSLSGFAVSKYKEIRGQLEKFFSLATVFKAIIDGALRFSKISTDIGKNLGYGADNANRVTSNMVRLAQSSLNVNVTLKNAGDAANELNNAIGFVAEYSDDALETQIMLTKQFGLTGEEAAGIYRFSVLTGQASKTVNDNMVKAFVATRNNLKVGVPFKATIAEAAKVSGRLAANLQNDPTGIVKAVVATKALGSSLEQTVKQGEALLNFESSIENELKAELITGKQLNLERARAAALVGDQVTLAQELSSQVGSLADFQKMNVIQQKSIAEAVGLTADELADQLRKQELAIKNGESLAELTEREAKEAQERQDIQEKFNNAVLKLQDALGNILAGPLSGLIEGFANILSSATGLYSVLGLIATVSLVKMITGLTTALALKRLSTRESIRGATADIAGASARAGGSAASIPGVGWLIAGGVAAALFGALMGYLAGAKTGDDVISPGYGKRMLFGPEGAVAFNNNDTIVAGTDLGGGGKGGGRSIDISPLVAAINEVRNAVNALANKPQPAMAIQVGAEKLGEVVGNQLSTGTSQAKSTSYSLA
jgi:hypothetical protein